MRKIGLIAAVLAAAVIPATAGATVPYDGSGCDYTDQQTAVGAGGVTAYEGSGQTGQATAAVGACTYSATGTQLGPVTFHGGSVEAGVGTPVGGPGGYAIVDGDNQNTGDPTGSSDGYIGVSNFETSPPKGDCTSGSGTNSGGCFELKSVQGLPAVTLPIPLIACGNTTGPTWDSAGRDGCAIP